MDTVCQEIKAGIDALNLNNNIFFRRFRAEALTKEQLTVFCQQYYLYIRTFPQILAGLAHRVDSEEVRVQLARTVMSELGDCHGLPHFQLFERVLAAVGVQLEDYEQASYMTETMTLVAGLRRIFLTESPVAAVGGHYTIEETGLPMLEHLYEGFRQYPGPDVRAMEYFHLHLFLEADHVSWIEQAVGSYAADPSLRVELVQGGLAVAQLLNQFWLGLYKRIYGCNRHELYVAP